MTTGVAQGQDESGTELSVGTQALLDDAAVARIVRARVGMVAGIALPAVGLSVWLGWDGTRESVLIPGSLGLYLCYLFAKAELFPLRFRHLARPSPLRGVLRAEGMPAEYAPESLSPTERRLVARDLLDELGDGAEGFWNSRFGKSLGRILAGVGTAGWLVAAGLALVFDGWGSAAWCLVASLAFAVPLWLGVRDDRLRSQAIAFLAEEWDVESGHSNQVTPTQPSDREAVPQ